MFENVLAQERVVADLSRMIIEKKIPTSMLFEGPHYTGKLTTALEFARSVTCAHGRADWNCTCFPCRQHRLLVHPDTKLLGHRDFMEEIVAASDVLRRTGSLAARYLFVRSVRKVLRRFDPELWDESDKRWKSAGAPIEELNELLDAFVPDEESTASPVEEKTIKQVEALAGKIVEFVPKENIPVEQIRRLAQWAHRTTGQNAKVVILTDADRMGDSSKNALLKLLEEPPRDTYCILLTTARDSILPTIRSRLRPFRFRDRGPAETRVVLERIFRETGSDYQTLRDYFLAWHISPDLVRNEGTAFLQAVLSGDRSGFFTDNRDLKLLADDRLVFHAFLVELTNAAERTFRAALTGAEGDRRVDAVVTLERWNAIIREAFERVERINVNPAVTIETLYYRMRDAV
jgi:DNA polymerase III delta prime subunit